MTLATVQQVLAQLYLDTELRHHFFTDPQVVGQKLGLNYQEIEQLSQLSRQQVELFARSLKFKRLGEVKELLPLTYQSLGSDFTKFFWQYAETFCPTGIKKHKQDAINFCTFLERVEEIAWVWDVARSEKARLLATESQSNFRYAIYFLKQTLFRKYK